MTFNRMIIAAIIVTPIVGFGGIVAIMSNHQPEHAFFTRTRPDRADAMNCLIDAELRKMDRRSIWLPENGHSNGGNPDFVCPGVQ